jgi:hypothetical protein
VFVSEAKDPAFFLTVSPEATGSFDGVPVADATETPLTMTVVREG